MTLDAIPALDISGYLADPSSQEGRAFVADLGRACHEVGFAHLIGHGIDPTVEAAVLGHAAEFFARPEEDRLEVVNTNTRQFRGYTRLGMERTGGKSDFRDQLDIGPERAALELGPDDPTFLRVRGPNQWPSTVPALRPAVESWMTAMEHLGRTVLHSLAESLGQPADALDGVIGDEPEVLVKLIRYPGVPATDGQGVGAHNDSGLLTFILTDGTPGLQVQHGGGFIDVPACPGAYVLNLGEMLQRATGGYVQATRHRVVSPPEGTQRISAAYFFNPALESRLSPIDMPAELVALIPADADGQNADPNDPVFGVYGENWMKFRLRSHPDVAAIHHADLVAAQAK